MALREVLRKAETDQNADFLREAVRGLTQALMEAECSRQAGAGRHERTPQRGDYRDRYRERPWDTRAGSMSGQPNGSA